MSYFIMLKLKDSGTGTSYGFIQKPTLCCKKKDNIMYFQWKEVGSRVSFTFVYLIGCFGWRFCLLGLVFLVGILRGRGIALGCRTKVDSMISTYTCNTKHFHKNAELEKISSEAFQQYTSIRTSVRPTISCELFMCLKNPIFFSLGLQQMHFTSATSFLALAHIFTEQHIPLGAGPGDLGPLPDSSLASKPTLQGKITRCQTRMHYCTVHPLM